MSEGDRKDTGHVHAPSHVFRAVKIEHTQRYKCSAQITNFWREILQKSKLTFRQFLVFNVSSGKISFLRLIA